MPAEKRRFQLANPTAPTAEPVPAQQPEAPARPGPARHAAAQPAEPPKWDARLSLTLSRAMKRDLDIARADDGIEGTARIRAMIALWQSDDRLRKRIDREAKTYR